MTTPTVYVLHPERGGTGTGIIPKHGVVVHDSEGTNDHTQLLIDMTLPGDRDNGHGGKYGSGYNAIALETEPPAYYQVADGTRSPYAAPPLNGSWWHICIPGKAAQTRDQWLTEPSRTHIRAVAQFIVDKWHEDGQTWPLTYQTWQMLKAAGQDHCAGWTEHWQVSQGLKKPDGTAYTDHYDPGPNFPLDVLAADIAALTNPQPSPDPDPSEDTMLQQITVKGDAAVLLRDGLDCTWIKSAQVQKDLVAAGIVTTDAPTVVARDVYSALRLVGPAPDYTGVDNTTFPGRTVVADFAAHQP